MTEQWKIIEGYQNYMVSSYGNVKNIKTDKILKPFFQGLYHAVWLGAGNKYYMHKIVGNAFLEKKENCIIDHIDCNKLNNNVNNLRYISDMKNHWNTNLYKTNLSTKEKNISKTKCGSFCVRIHRNHKYVFIKNYDTLDEAIKGRNEYLEKNYLIV